MKILFVMRDDGDMTEPMNLMLLSALAKRAGHQTQIMVLERDDISNALTEFKPNIAAFSCITGNQKAYIKAASEVKHLQPSILTVFGGPHFTYFPGEIMRHPEAIDVICVGEGDDAWPELLMSLESGMSLDKVQNLITKNNSQQVMEVSSKFPTTDHCEAYQMKRGIIRARKTDLDSLPFLDRGLIYGGTAFKNRFKRTHMASRGCPFRCAYCFEPQFNDLYKGLGRVRQYYSVDRFLDELEFVKSNWDTRYFKFYDDVFLPFPNAGELAWHEEFCSKYPKRIGLPFHLLTRCDVVMTVKRKHSINLIRDWKKTGLASLTMSIESGNRFIHDHIIVRDMSQQDVKDAFKLARDEHVYTFPNTIVAIPAPLIPAESDTKFNEKIIQVGKELRILKTINRANIDIDDITKLIRSWLPNEKQDHQKRKFIVEMLKLFGMHQDNLSYNVESVIFTLERNPGFAEFLTLFPYPGTKANNWCIARGDFDGDFEKLHASYQTKTPLACFSERERDIIQNLTLIGTFLTLFWGSWNRFVRTLARPMTWLFVNRLSYVTHSWIHTLFLWLYTFSKAYMHRTRIYPIRYTFGEKVRFYTDMIRLDFWKQEKERKNLSLRRPDRKLTLGGPLF
ncbi:MAG: hypothetical protein A3B17_02180 [Candidatus Yanofskybacteria bacterium RIFCSPLOWO2_01_FULL_45_72]|nr:MAG: hypothetical protein A3B17_02180 [Candidatus Yanofskybacteria bacterium RIFCSPLOWO2_01_FULL_45_72]